MANRTKLNGAFIMLHLLLDVNYIIKKFIGSRTKNIRFLVSIITNFLTTDVVAKQ